MNFMASVTAGQGPGPGRAARRRGTGILCLTLLGLTLGALAHVAVHAKRIDVAMELGREHDLQLRLQEERRRLEIEIGRLKAPGQLIKVAHDKLKMGPASPGEIRSLERK